MILSLEFLKFLDFEILSFEILSFEILIFFKFWMVKLYTVTPLHMEMLMKPYTNNNVQWPTPWLWCKPAPTLENLMFPPAS